MLRARKWRCLNRAHDFDEPFVRRPRGESSARADPGLVLRVLWYTIAAGPSETRSTVGHVAVGIRVGVTARSYLFEVLRLLHIRARLIFVFVKNMNV